MAQDGGTRAELAADAKAAGAGHANQLHVPSLPALPACPDESFRLLLDLVEQAAAILTERGDIVCCNSRFAGLVKSRPEQLVGSALSDFVPGSDKATLGSFLVAAAGGAARQPISFVSTDGNVLPVLLSAGIVASEPVRRLWMTALLHASTDDGGRQIDDRRLISALLDCVAEAVIVCDASLRILHCSIEAVRLCGHNPAGEKFHAAFPLSFSSPISPGLDVFLSYPMAGRFLRSIDATMPDTSGGTLHVLLTVGPLLSVDGRVAGCVVTLVDITHQKRTMETLRVGEERFRVALQHAPIMVYTIDRQLRTTWIHNPMLAFTASQVIGNRLDEVVPKDDVAEFLALNQWVLVAGRETRQEVRIQWEGNTYHLDVSVEPLRDPWGRIVGITGAAMDITQNKLASQAMEKAKQAAETANREKDVFLATLSHELRTPLAPVLMSASALEARAELPAEVREEIAMIRRNVEMAARLIDDLLDLTRIGRGKLELHQRVVDVCPLLKQAVGVCAADAAAKHLRLTLDAQPGVHYVRADPERMQQAIWNLVRNAVKFTPSGGVVAVRCANALPGRFIIEVADTGIGIDAETLPRLFAPFEQGGREVTRRYGGLGLGLVISKMLVELHGGSLRAHSDGKGRGATFTVELPAAHMPKDKPARVHAVEPGPHRRLRILLVEDHIDTANTMAQLLRTSGHHVVIANSVATAIDFAAIEPYDLVLSDLGLPDGSGLDLMRELSRRHGLKGIAISGYGMQADIEKSREAGFLEHIVKPVNIQKLEELIDSISARVLRLPRARGSPKKP